MQGLHDYITRSVSLTLRTSVDAAGRPEADVPEVSRLDKDTIGGKDGLSRIPEFCKMRLILQILCENDHCGWKKLNIIPGQAGIQPDRTLHWIHFVLNLYLIE